jgi:hypothetical protein
LIVFQGHPAAERSDKNLKLSNGGDSSSVPKEQLDFSDSSELACSSCHLALIGPHMEVDEFHRYHADCLKCAHCGTSLAAQEFFMFEDLL